MWKIGACMDTCEDALGSLGEGREELGTQQGTGSSCVDEIRGVGFCWGVCGLCVLGFLLHDLNIELVLFYS